MNLSHIKDEIKGTMTNAGQKYNFANAYEEILRGSRKFWLMNGRLMQRRMLSLFIGRVDIRQVI
jgi:hypothetical protein